MTSSALRYSALVILIAALALAGCRGAGTPGQVEPQGSGPAAGQPAAGQTSGEAAGTEVAAVVNGEPISMEAFNRELARFEAGRAALGYEVSSEAGYRQQVLDQMIDDVLFRQQAAQQGISISDEAVDAEINSMIAEYGEDYFNSWLQANGYTLEEFREEERTAMIVQALLPSDDELVPPTAAHVHARHILVTTEAEAQAVLQRLQAGEDFAAIAAEVSTDVTTRDRGGDLGWFPRGALLVPEVEQAAFSLEPGQTSGVVASAWGYHIVQTIEVDPNREVQPENLQQLKQKAIADWLAQLRAGADIQQAVTLTP